MQLKEKDDFKFYWMLDVQIQLITLRSEVRRPIKYTEEPVRRIKPREAI
jgi:hypothetical protein